MKANDTTQDQNIIYFLQMSKNLPKWYYNLAVSMNVAGITLVPIKQSQIFELYHRDRKFFLISVVSNFSHKKYFETLLKEPLKYLLLNKKVNLYHLSSFERVDNIFDIKVKSHYNYFRLPCNLKEFAAKLVEDYHKEFEKSENWPGGRGPRLSDEVIG